MSVFVDPEQPIHWVAESDAWGLIRSEGSGPRWICAEIFQGDSLGLSHPTVERMGDGAIAVANRNAGLWRSDASACEWYHPEGSEGLSATDLALTSDRTRGFVLGSSAADPDAYRLYDSVDDLNSVAPLGAPLPTDFVPTSLAVQDASQLRLYVVGITPATRDVALVVSEDEGQTWSMRRADGATAPQGRPVLRAHPTAEGRLFLRVDPLPLSQNAPDPPDTLYFSPDDGETFSLVLDSASDLPGFAFSPDQRAVAVAGPADGLLVASVDELETAGAAAWSERNGGSFWGLSWTQAGLYAGTDDFVEAGSRAWLAVSSDEGATFSPLMSICDVAPLECPDTSRYAAVCTDVFQRLSGFEQAILQSSRCRRDVTPDAGGLDAGGPSPAASVRGGCDCTIRQSSTAPDGAASSILLLAAWLGRVARGRRRARPTDHGSVQR